MERRPSYGELTELHVRRAASVYGMPDFVFRPSVVSKGTSSREAGDGVILLGNRALIVQSKARDISRLGLDDEDRARRWLDKNVAKAIAQINGTHRTLVSGSFPMVSERGIRIGWRPERADRYFGVVVVNYTSPTDYIPSVGNAHVPTVVLQVRDWERLNRTIRTTSGLFSYLEQRLATDGLVVPLGDEEDVLAALLFVERSGLPVRLQEGMPPKGFLEHALLAYPDLLFGSHEDDRFSLYVDAVIAGAADRDPAFTSDMDPDVYLKIIHHLEEFPRLERGALGKKMLEKCRLAGEQARARCFVAPLPSGGRLLYVSDPRLRPERGRDLQAFAAAVHAGFSFNLPGSHPANVGTTIAIATEPHPNDGRSHDYVCVEGELTLTDEGMDAARQLLRAEFGDDLPV